FFDVDDVAVCGILGAGARPGHALSLRSLGRQLFPSRAAEDLQVALVGELTICNCYLAENALKQAFLLRVLRSLELLVKLGVNQRIDSADEEAGHACH